MERVVLVTGASSGVGLALCQRLLEEDGRIHLCIACRNTQKNEDTRDLILASHPAAQVSTVEVDLGNMASVLRVARELRCRFQRLDFVYLNAGIMPNPHVNFKALWHGLLTGKVLHMLTTAEGIMTQTDRLNGDGLQEVFTTNLFGHFMLVRQLEPLLCSNEKPVRLIWTSSSNARESAFSLSDFQHAKGQESYSSSKYATDLTSVVLNRKFNKQVYLSVRRLCLQTLEVQALLSVLMAPCPYSTLSRQDVRATCLPCHKGLLDFVGSPSPVIVTLLKYLMRKWFSHRRLNPFPLKACNGHRFNMSISNLDLLEIAISNRSLALGLYSSVVCPGLVMSNMTYRILPVFLWKLLMPIMWLIRFFAKTYTLTPYNGAEAHVWLFKQKPEYLDPLVKYHSCTSGLGKSYVEPRKMEVDEEIAEKFYQKLLELEKQTLERYSDLLD